jgi:hypothetical protein
MGVGRGPHACLHGVWHWLTDDLIQQHFAALAVT